MFQKVETNNGNKRFTIVSFFKKVETIDGNKRFPNVFSKKDVTYQFFMYYLMLFCGTGGGERMLEMKILFFKMLE